MSDVDIILKINTDKIEQEKTREKLDEVLKSKGIDYRPFFIDSKFSSDFFQNFYLENFKTSKIVLEDKRNIIYDSRIHKGLLRTLCEGKRAKIKPYLTKELKDDGRIISPLIGFIELNSIDFLENIAKFYFLAKKHGVVIFNGDNKDSLSKLPKESGGYYFEYLSFKDHDYSTIRFFRSELLEFLDGKKLVDSEFDFYLLKSAKKLGFKILNSNLDFKKKTPSLLNAEKFNVRTGFYFLESKFFKKKKRKLIKSLKYKGKKFFTYTDIPLEYSAVQTLYPWQKVTILSLLFLVLFALFYSPLNTIVLLLAILTSVYFSDLIFSFYLLYRTLNFSPEIKFKKSEFLDLDESKLPIYSILCPLYKEAKVLPFFVKSIEAIDWPKDKLDVIFLLEEDDKETHQALKTISIPSYFRVFTIPNSSPKTKPKACNFGLLHAIGDYIVVYDAEDRPDPLQLKKAFIAFSKLSADVACIQSKLNYYNKNQNLLTRIFSAEYSLWFDLILPGLQSINTVIPLGGTSNHFKTEVLRKIHGWDPFNVTEDCDLGVRLFKNGYKTAIMDSTTLEEANSNLSSWIRQRSRWIKGYIQTFLVHNRNPFKFFQERKLHLLLFNLVIGARTTFVIINPLLWLQTFLYFTFKDLLGYTIESFYPSYVYYLALTCLVLGNFMYFYSYMIACGKRRFWDLVRYMPFVPFYWFLSSISAAIAFYQLIKKPYFWEKTEHGLFLKSLKNKYKLSLFPENFGISKSFYFFDTFNLLISLVKKNIIDLINLFKPLPSYSTNKKNIRRVLIFNWRDIKHKWAGGAEVYIHWLAKCMVKDGYEVTIFCSWDKESKRNEFLDGITILRRGGFYTVYIFAFLYYIFKFRGRFDLIIDSQNGIPFFTPLFVKVPKVLLIYHVHQEVFRSHLILPLALIAVFLESKLMPLVYRGVNVVTISESSKKDILEKGFVSEDQISIVTPGVSPEFFVDSVKTPYPSFVYLGRLRPWKNVDIAIEAFFNILKKYKDTKLFIAGFGESLEFLRLKVKALNLEDSVIFKGKVSEKEKVLLFSQSWASIQPSSFEGWGITVIESNATGTPVIASDVSGLRNSVIDGKTGILFPVKNVEKLTQAMEKIIVDENFRNYLSNEAKIWAKNFAWEYSAKLFENILEKVNLEKSKLPFLNFAKAKS